MAYLVLNDLGTFKLPFLDDTLSSTQYVRLMLLMLFIYILAAGYLIAKRYSAEKRNLANDTLRLQFVSITFVTTLVWLIILALYHHQVIYSHSSLRSIMPALLVLIPLVYIGASLVIPYFSLSMLLCLVLNQLADDRAFSASWVLQGVMFMTLVLIVGSIFFMVRRGIHFIAEIEYNNFKLTEKLIHSMNIDMLLAIPNRQSFFSRISNKLLRKTEESPVACILMIDVDHFKKYNDHYGHPAGDLCLQKVAACLKECLRDDVDMVGRYGGEEFIAFLDDASAEGAVVVANRLMARMAELNLEHVKSPTASHVTLSIGIACWQPGASLEALCDLADQALYRAKRAGRNQYQVFNTEVPAISEA
ncbi:GGDEF domain-containing protein [Pseudaeromonas sharmana]|uniref:diguanylate cyclase n=1 Tax=Pseudaeromonas sharmana TaxID=328412 RepID=A0ABV8CP16_9GAMM